MADLFVVVPCGKTNDRSRSRELENFSEFLQKQNKLNSINLYLSEPHVTTAAARTNYIKNMRKQVFDFNTTYIDSAKGEAAILVGHSRSKTLSKVNPTSADIDNIKRTVVCKQTGENGEKTYFMVLHNIFKTAQFTKDNAFRKYLQYANALALDGRVVLAGDHNITRNQYDIILSEVEQQSTLCFHSYCEGVMFCIIIDQNKLNISRLELPSFDLEHTPIVLQLHEKTNKLETSSAENNQVKHVNVVRSNRTRTPSTLVFYWNGKKGSKIHTTKHYHATKIWQETSVPDDRKCSRCKWI